MSRKSRQQRQKTSQTNIDFGFGLQWCAVPDILSPLVKVLAEYGNVETALAEHGAEWRRGRCLRSRYVGLHERRCDHLIRQLFQLGGYFFLCRSHVSETLC